MDRIQTFALACLCLALALGIAAMVAVSEPGLAGYYDNTSIESRVNVTNIAPAVSLVVLHQQSNGATTALDLAEGTTQTLVCNATVDDYNGWPDIIAVNATIYATASATSGSIDDNNNHYTITACTNTSINITSLAFSCSFNVWYYANNDTWNCEVNAKDIMNATGSTTDVTPPTVNSLAALNVSTNVIDFGNMPPGNTTDNPNERNVNVTNTGNVNFNLSLNGFGAYFNDSLVMNCTLGNISVGYLRYNVAPTQNFDASMANLTNNKSISGIPGGYRIPQRVDDLDSTKLNSTNSTYWKLRIPIGYARGFCNGTVIFSVVI